jgi:hypothetical protein
MAFVLINGTTRLPATLPISDSGVRNSKRL